MLIHGNPFNFRLEYLLSLFICSWIKALFSLKRPITYHFKSFFVVFLLFSVRIRNTHTRPYLLNLLHKKHHPCHFLKDSITLFSLLFNCTNF